MERKEEKIMHDIFAFGDIHGQWNLYKTIIDYCLNQDPECSIIFLGDACDRGPDGYKIMRDLLDNPQIIYLMGNHEEIFINACNAIIGYHAQNDELYNKLHSYNKEEAEKFLKSFQFNLDVNLACANAGDYTLIDWLSNGADEDFLDKIRALPYTFSWENIDFCHAGSQYKAFQEISQNEHDKVPLNAVSKRMLIWDRDSIPFGWKTGRICVHGHTPTIYLPAKAYGSKQKTISAMRPACWGELLGGKNKRGGKKIDIDTGATFTGRAYVLNVLTLNVIGFYDPAVTKQNGEIKFLEQYKINID